MPAQAGMIGTDRAIAAAQDRQDAREAGSDREKLRSFVARADVRNHLAALGVSAAAASERVDALSDQEARDLAGKLELAPAGGNLGLLALLLIVVLVLVVFQAAYKR
jgi:hypothetical protein